MPFPPCKVSLPEPASNTKEIVELDKYNYICVIKGVDYMAATRVALGLQ